METFDLFSVRFEVLLQLFQLSHGMSELAVSVDSLTRAVGRGPDEVWPTAIWLIETDLAIRANTDAMTITFDGVQQVIDAVTHPQEATRCFPPGVAAGSTLNRNHLDRQ